MFLALPIIAAIVSYFFFIEVHLPQLRRRYGELDAQEAGVGEDPVPFSGSVFDPLSLPEGVATGTDLSARTGDLCKESQGVGYFEETSVSKATSASAEGDTHSNRVTTGDFAASLGIDLIPARSATRASVLASRWADLFMVESVCLQMILPFIFGCLLSLAFRYKGSLITTVSRLLSSTSSATSTTADMDMDAKFQCQACRLEQPADMKIECPRGHGFCSGCLRSYAEEELAHRKTEIGCFHHPPCSSVFSDAALALILPDVLLTRLYRLREQELTQTAGCTITSDCSFCAFARLINTPELPTFWNSACRSPCCLQYRRTYHRTASELPMLFTAAQPVSPTIEQRTNFKATSPPSYASSYWWEDMGKPYDFNSCSLCEYADLIDNSWMATFWNPNSRTTKPCRACLAGYSPIPTYRARPTAQTVHGLKPKPDSYFVRVCPACQSIIIRQDRCNQLKCAKCETSFCATCDYIVSISNCERHFDSYGREGTSRHVCPLWDE